MGESRDLSMMRSKAVKRIAVLVLFIVAFYLGRLSNSKKSATSNDLEGLYVSTGATSDISLRRGEHKDKTNIETIAFSLLPVTDKVVKHRYPYVEARSIALKPFSLRLL
jgi:hypothetical protein